MFDLSLDSDETSDLAKCLLVLALSNPQLHVIAYNCGFETIITRASSGDRAVELCIENGNKVFLYCFHSKTNDAIEHCEELVIEDPQSLTKIETCLKKLI